MDKDNDRLGIVNLRELKIFDLYMSIEIHEFSSLAQGLIKKLSLGFKSNIT